MTAKNVCKQTNETATKIIAEVGYGFGYRDVAVIFASYRDLKVKWTRSYAWIEFQFSDYLKDAPDDVIRNIGETIFARIVGRPTDTNTMYGEETTAWLTAPEFALDHQDIFIKRCRGFNENAYGVINNLNDSLDRISKMGLVDIDKDTKIGWVPSIGRGRKTGFSSTLMKVIGISERLDYSDVTQDMFDYCVYCELCHIAMGFDPSTMYDPERLLEMVHKYPNWEKIDAELDEVGLETNN